ncbi:hypothetical protein ElyMa_003345200 [Elysia marginata]|uniref:Uncharacterized protein n=1 Tax=Elysia marginata TaxID=1093978 RepID=A0AAV4JJV5_9GAST|nr:hypothetical protein ElyMa_003345200 [Elysia marginata]
MEIDAFFPAQQQRIDTHSKEIKVKMCTPILQFMDEVTFCLESHTSQMMLQGFKQMKVRGCEVCSVGRMRNNFSTVALQPLLCKKVFLETKKCTTALTSSFDKSLMGVAILESVVFNRTFINDAETVHRKR